MPGNEVVTLDEIGKFICLYAAEYRKAYEKAVSAPPQGPGYPKLPISPYLGGSTFSVYVTDQDVVINQESPQPPHQWYIADGPALKVDYEPSKTPPEVTAVLEQHGLKGKPIGIYRIVAKSPLENAVWRGKINGITKTISVKDNELGIELTIHSISGGLTELVSHLTFGAFGQILDAHLPKENSNIGTPHIVRQFGVFLADLNNRRYFHHLEIFGQSDSCAWDHRLAHVRAQLDVRNDFARTMSNPTEEGGGTISFGNPNAWIRAYSDRLTKMRGALADLQSALLYQGEDVEAVFHDILEKHPLLLDVYGRCESKPRFQYPDQTKSPVGKTYLEPDFLITYINCPRCTI
jgi:hypothetical protein